jgi:hypothetical protein
VACLNPGLDDLQERIATGTRAVTDYELPLGLHPGATPANPVVQEVLILRGFLEAVLRWRRGRDCHAGHRTPIKSGIYCKPEVTVCTSPVSRSRWDLLHPLRNIDYRFDRHSGDRRYINLEGRFPLPLPLCPSAPLPN